MQAVSEIDQFPPFTKRAYPCWVVSLTNLAAFDELPAHEDCIEKLEELLPDSTSPSCAYSFFISQNWEGGRPSDEGYYNLRGRPHPDNAINTKLRWLKRCWLVVFVAGWIVAVDRPSHHPTAPLLPQHQTTYEASTRPPDLGMVRYHIDSSTRTRSAGVGDRLALRVHATVYQVAHHPLGARFP